MYTSFALYPDTDTLPVRTLWTHQVYQCSPPEMIGTCTATKILAVEDSFFVSSIIPILWFIVK